jgi:hypothetical protein
VLFRSVGPHVAPTDENFKRLLERLRSLEPRPTVIVHTGGGYQAFWVFPEPLPAVEHLERVEAASMSIARLLGSDAVQNVNRWMRLPGTINLPNEAKRSRGRVPREARVVEASWDRTWSFEADPIPRFPDDYEAYAADDRPIGRGFVDLPLKWQKLIRTGDAKDYAGDRSRLVIAACFALVRRGWSDDEIAPFLLEEHYKISAHVLEQGDPRAYARRQVAQARAQVARDWDHTSQGNIDAASPRNFRRALEELGVKLSHNSFSERSYVNGVGPFRQLDDPVESEIRIHTHAKFGFTPLPTVFRDVVATVARESSFHPVVDYLASLTWDRVERIERWLVTSAGAVDSEYTRAVSRLILIAAARRVRYPGCKFDQMLVLVDPNQGTGKSTAISGLVPDSSWFSDSLPLRLTDQKAIEQLSGRWIIECAELQGMHQADVEVLKAFLSRTEDRARLAYGHHPVTYARRCVFFGTTNTEAFLRDVKNRRFWPVRVSRVDLAWIAANRDQLWAEAAHLEAAGESIVLPEPLWEVAAVHQEAARYGDPWTDPLATHLAPFSGGRIASTEVWKLLGKPVHQRGAIDNGRMTEVMRELGWERSTQRLSGGPPTRCFTRGEDRTELFAYVDQITGAVELQAVPVRPDVETARDAHRRRDATAPDDDLPF